MVEKNVTNIHVGFKFNLLIIEMNSYIPVMLQIGPRPEEIDHVLISFGTNSKERGNHQFCRRMVDIRRDGLLHRRYIPSNTDFVYTHPADSFDSK